jgi:GntR family transcriptional regulator
MERRDEMSWDLQTDRPIYTQLIEQMEIRILSGAYPLGSRLPSVRDMAQEAAVNPNTMQRALSQLEEAGLLVTHRTSGRSVTEDAQMISQAKRKLAKEQIDAFLKNMGRLGFEHAETLSLVSSMLEEMKK